MNIDITAIPTTIDGIHLLLAMLSVVFVVLFFLKAKQKKIGLQEASKPVAQPTAPLPAADPVLKEASPDAALQLLTLLQQEARFIDFVNEDLSGHSDADIGAVARIVHEGAGKTVKEYFKLDPVRTEEEESRITVPAGFNAAEIRLTGNVVGTAPFSGTLVHRGWKVTEVKLPKLAKGHDTTVIAAAEVEL